MAPTQAPDPNFEHVFGFGQHLGQQPDLGGLDPNAILNGNIWDQPYQSPYGAGPGSPYQDQPEPVDPAMYGGGAPGVGMPQPGMGQDQYLVGPTPDQSQASPFAERHPNWAAVGNYLSSDRFKDALMSGVIAGQMATNPQGALQLAMQWKQHRDQRAYQAEQNALQRENQRELAKTRGEYQKEARQQAQFRTRASKLDAAIRQAKIDPTPIIAKYGEPNEDNFDQIEHEVQTQVAQQAEIEKAKKELTTDINNKVKIMTTASKSGKMVGSDYTRKGAPKYDEDFATAMDEITQHRQKYMDQTDRLRDAREAREKAATKLINKKLADGKPDTKTKAEIQRNISSFGRLETRLSSAQDKLLEAKATLASYISGKIPEDDAMMINARAAVETEQERLDGVYESLMQNDREFEKITGKTAPSLDFEEDMAATAKRHGITLKRTEEPVSSTPAAANDAALPAQESSPGSDINLYFKFVDKFGQAQADAAWKERHGNAPPPRR